MADNLTRPDYLRRAAEARALATDAKDDITRTILLKLAALWDKLAERSRAVIFATCCYGVCLVVPPPICLHMTHCPCCDAAASLSSRRDFDVPAI